MEPKRVFSIKPETKIPEFARELIIKRGQEEAVIITPSGQQWNNLSPSRQEEWKQIIRKLGADPEDYLAHLSQMLAQSPKGAE